MKNLIFLCLAAILYFSSCSTQQVSQSGGNTSGGTIMISEDSLDRIQSSDPDGIPGSGSTYGTGTGVSGQTPAGTGNGSGNTGRSGVGIKEEL